MNTLTTELMHHGVQGMRWGIRRYQPYGIGYDPQKVGKFIGNMKRTPKGYQKALNRLSKDAEYNQAFGQEHDKKQEKYTRQSNEYFKRMQESNSAHAKKKFEKKSMKYAQKALEERAKRDSYNQLVKESDEMVNKIIADAATHNFDITQKMDRKLVDTGNRALRVLSSVLLGPIPGTLATFRSQEVDSNRYKVTKNMDPSRNVGNLTYMITPERVLENNNRGADRVAKALGERKQIMEQAKVNTSGFRESNVEGWKRNVEGGYQKQVKQKDGSSITFISDDINDNFKQQASARLEKNLERIKREAPRYYVEQNYERILKFNPKLEGKSKAELAKMFKVDAVNSNGTVDLEPSKESGMQWAFPYVESGFDNKTGKLLFGVTGTDS